MKTLDELNEKMVGDSQNQSNQSNLPFNYFGKDGKPRRVLTFVDDDGGQYVMNQQSIVKIPFPGFWLNDDKTGVIDQIKAKYPDFEFKMGFSIITGFSGIPGPDSNNPDLNAPLRYVYPYLTLDQVKILQADGHEIYSHTVNHVNANEYLRLDKNELIKPENEFQKALKNEYKQSKIWLNAHGFDKHSNVLVYPGGLGVPDNSPEKPKYPNGKITEDFIYTVKSAREEGYNYAVNTCLPDKFTPLPEDRNYTLRRIDFDNYDPNNPDKLITSGDIIDIIQDSSYIDFKNPIADKSGWFIAMTHAYVVKNDQHTKDPDAPLNFETFKLKQQKILAVVDYCLSHNIDILPFSEAVKYFNNKS